MHMIRMEPVPLSVVEPAHYKPRPTLPVLFIAAIEEALTDCRHVRLIVGVVGDLKGYVSKLRLAQRTLDEGGPPVRIVAAILEPRVQELGVIVLGLPSETRCESAH